MIYSHKISSDNIDVVKKTMKKQILKDKILESLRAVLPITVIVFVLAFSVVPLPVDSAMMFLTGAVFLVVGMALFTLGAELAMRPMGETLGAFITKKRNLPFFVAMALVLGFIITISEPGLQVLAEQVATIPTGILVATVAAGVGLFLAIAFLRTLFQFPLQYLLIGSYVLLFIFAYFAPDEFLPIAFDSGGATTGAMTVPFIMALGVGISSVRSDRTAETDSFGLIGICSIGPIFAVMLLGMIYSPEGAFTQIALPSIANTNLIFAEFLSALPQYILDVAIALCPVALFFLLFQLLALRLSTRQLLRITIGLVYTFLGLVLFLTGANVGFLPAGNLLGEYLAASSFNWMLVPIAMVIGYFIIMAEPAVFVLNKQVAEITDGAVSQKAMGQSLSIGVSIALGFSMLRVLTGISILWILLPGYLLALALPFFVPKIFTSIAFDSGGVASGPLTSAFVLPLAIGASISLGGNVVLDAFGLIAMVALTPLVTIQVLGLYYKVRDKYISTAADIKPADNEIISLPNDDEDGE